jgi:geranylgeranyl pyrophosphate synthase
LERYSKLDQRQPAPPSPADVDNALQKYRLTIERVVRETDLIHSSPLSHELKAVMEAGGKRLRAILVLMGCEAVSGQYTSAIPAALAYELAHQASLVQDDVFDNSDIRHDKETVHKRQGTIGAFLVSDLLIFEIFNQVAKYESTPLTKARMARLLTFIAHAASLTIRGEYLETKYTSRSSLSEDEYLEVAALKTGSLLAATAASGALVGGAPEKVVDSMYRFGYNLGVAFQIRDDVLDITGDSAKLGKPVLKDLQNNACNIVLIRAIEKADAYQKSQIDSMLYKKWFALEDVKNLMHILNEVKAIEYASKLGAKYAALSRSFLKPLRASPVKEKLAGLTYALEVRKV